MTAAQLALFLAILALWAIFMVGIYPWLQGRALRREVLIISFVVLGVLLLVSLLTAPNIALWLEYVGITALIVALLLAYNYWAMRAQVES